MCQGHVYILSNSIAPDVIKVGRTKNLDRRLQEHNNASNSVGEWELFWSYPVEKARDAERTLLSALEKFRVPGKREQFAITGEGAVEIAEQFFDPDLIRQRLAEEERLQRQAAEIEERRRETARRAFMEFKRDVSKLGVEGEAAMRCYARENNLGGSSRQQLIDLGVMRDYDIPRFIKSGGFEYWLNHPYMEEALEQSRESAARREERNRKQKQLDEERAKRQIDGMVERGRSWKFVEHEVNRIISSPFRPMDPSLLQYARDAHSRLSVQESNLAAQEKNLSDQLRKIKPNKSLQEKIRRTPDPTARTDMIVVAVLIVVLAYLMM